MWQYGDAGCERGVPSSCRTGIVVGNSTVTHAGRRDGFFEAPPPPPPSPPDESAETAGAGSSKSEWETTDRIVGLCAGGIVAVLIVAVIAHYSRKRVMRLRAEALRARPAMTINVHPSDGPFPRPPPDCEQPEMWAWRRDKIEGWRSKVHPAPPGWPAQVATPDRFLRVVASESPARPMAMPEAAEPKAKPAARGLFGAPRSRVTPV